VNNDGRIKWPNGHDFAFTVFDDTDSATLENVSRVYGLLSDAGCRTTKSVWPLAATRPGRASGATCADREYANWAASLQQSGFEIALHNVTCHSSYREETVEGLERFRSMFGSYPASMANHQGCKESIYWGASRLTGARGALYRLLTIGRPSRSFYGHMEDSPYFWGDECRAKIRYVRNFVYPEINTLGACPAMPYHDLEKQYVNFWFASSDGANVNRFNECISESNQDELEEQGGACIMYTHFAYGFQNGGVHTRFRELMARLSRKNGWFVPVRTLLDFLRSQRTTHTISAQELARLERKWLAYKLRVGTC